MIRKGILLGDGDGGDVGGEGFVDNGEERVVFFELRDGVERNGVSVSLKHGYTSIELKLDWMIPTMD